MLVRLPEEVSKIAGTVAGRELYKRFEAEMAKLVDISGLTEEMRCGLFLHTLVLNSRM